MKSPSFITALVAAALASAAAVASDTRYVGENEIPTPLEVARALAGADFQPKLRRRGISMDHHNAPDAAPLLASSAAPTPAVSAAAPAAVRPAAPAPTLAAPATSGQSGGTLAVAIAFEFNSDSLQVQAQRQLDSIAEGLKLLDNAVIQIEGHTDSIGAAGYNQQLSERRAQAVRRYLVQQHDLPESALSIHGWGMSRPIPGLSPSAGQNRRVEFSLR